MKSKVHPTYKTKYRVANWAAYNQALVRRGDVTVWLSSEAIAAWTPREPSTAADTSPRYDIPANPTYGDDEEIIEWRRGEERVACSCAAPWRSGVSRAAGGARFVSD